MPRPKGNPNKPRTWGDMFYVYLARGYDYGYATFLADRWERNQTRKEHAS